MSFRFKMMGIEVMCDTAEEAYALASKVAAAQRHEPAPKQFSVVVQHTSNPAGATSVIDKPATKALFPDVKPPVARARSQRGFDKAKATSIFLKALDDAWPEGVSGDVLCSELGLTHPKALGGRLALINQYIQQAGFDPDNVYSMKRDSKHEGRRTWFAEKDSGNLRQQMV